MKVIISLLAAGLLIAANPVILYADRVEPRILQPSVTILCYHHFGIPKGQKDIYTVTPENFERQMELLQTKGFSVIPLSQYYDYLEGRGDLPERAVIITIDDGYKSTYTTAYPILKKFHYPFTVFVYTHLISSSQHFMTWEQIAEMAQNGVEIGSHSQNHPLLTSSKVGETEKDYQERIADELVGSKQIIEKHIKGPVRFFAYPYGAYNDFIMAEVQKAGYRGAVTVNPGPNGKGMDPFSINRKIITAETTEREFRAELDILPMSWVRESMTPSDGAMLSASPKICEVKVLEKETLRPGTCKIFVSGVGQVEGEYFPQEGVLRFDIKKPLRPGLHMVTVTAKDKEKDITRMGSWSFWVKKS